MPSIGIFSYVIASIAYLALAGWVIYRWGAGRGSRQFVITVLFNVVWAAVLAYHAWVQRTSGLGLIVLIELIRTILWILLVWRFLFGGDRRLWPRESVYWVHGTWIGVILVHVVVVLSTILGRPLLNPSFVYIGSQMLLAIVGYLLVYQFYKNSSRDQRWEVKFLCLGVGGLFAFDLMVFSLGYLFRGIEGDLWDARGAISAILAVLIAIAVSRMKAQSSELALSRKIVFYSTGMFGVGFYLVAIALGGYFIRVTGEGSWGTFALIVFLFGSIVFLASVLFSGQARARLRVFLDKNFFHYRYDYRKEWLSLTEALSTQHSDETLESRALQAMCRIVQSPGATLWQAQNNVFTVSAAWNMSEYAQCTESATDPFCEFLRQREWIIDKDEYRRDPENYGSLVLPSWFATDDKAWLVLPLLHNESLLGFMVIANSMAVKELTWEDRDLLKSVGRQVAGHLALHRSAEALAETRQFEAYNRLVAFIMHDMKNLIAQQSLVVRNAAKHKDNPEFIDDAIATVDNSVRRMNNLLEQLQRGDQGGQQRIVDLSRLCRAVIEQTTGQRKPEPDLVIDNTEVRVKLDRERMLMVLVHLVRNAQDATETDGSVTLFVGRDANRAIIEVQDTGSGMTPEFIRDRLFVPFDTTKGAKGMGIGVYQAREFVQAAHGELQVSSVLGRGSVFRVLLPLAEESP